ncbi:MAG: glycosyltransferase family 2 protein [Acidothermales bacterium]|nr:glycosyltransferase family 2 protein [Acidothermales bacterium]
MTAIVPTRGRAELLQRAVDAIRAQDYPGDVHCLVVYDGTEPDFSLCRDGRRSVLVCSNTRKPGLAGARNTGIILTQTELVAFCGDDDAWLPGKLSAQARRLAEVPDAALVSCGIRIESGGHTCDHRLDATEVSTDELLRGPPAELHPSSFLFRRQRLVDLGMVDEDAPGGFGVDYELLLRVARESPVANVPEVHALVRGNDEPGSGRDWGATATALARLLDGYPELRGSRAGEARVAGQIAFAHAALGDRRETLRWVRRTVRRDPRQALAYLALAIASGLVTPDAVLRRLHRRGRVV